MAALSRRRQGLRLLPALLALELLELPLLVGGRPGGFTDCETVSTLSAWPPWLESWPSGCMLRQEGLASGSAAVCNQSCWEDVSCPAWEHSPGLGCFWARPGNDSQCGGLPPPSANGIDDVGDTFVGALLAHGNVAARKQLGKGFEVRGLFSLGSLGGATDEEEASRCRLLCYSSHFCGFWQYGNSSCRLERPPNAVYAGNITQDTPLAALMVAGEELSRGCPHAPHPVWIAMGASFCGIGTLIVLWALCEGEGPTRENPLRPTSCFARVVKLFCPCCVQAKKVRLATGSGDSDSEADGSSSADDTSDVDDLYENGVNDTDDAAAEEPPDMKVGGSAPSAQSARFY
mmetsp:Transcript_30744/g.77757  ORF Transcript_30744/g.77757 Transcript_30744/m.77757 type:complete len:346 (+) Transcript_30744:73-1110(+)